MTRPLAVATCAAAEDQARTCAANDNARAPIVVLTPVGNGIELARALARVLVRRELIVANAIPDPVHCNDQRSMDDPCAHVRSAREPGEGTT